MSEAQPSQPQALAESLRVAVARTLEATARPAGPARERVAELADEVVERGRAAGGELARRRETVGGTIEDLARRGQEAGGGLARRGQGAGEAIARRIAALIEQARPEHSPARKSNPQPQPEEPD